MSDNLEDIRKKNVSAIHPIASNSNAIDCCKITDDLMTKRKIFPAYNAKWKPSNLNIFNFGHVSKVCLLFSSCLAFNFLHVASSHNATFCLKEVSEVSQNIEGNTSCPHFRGRDCIYLRDQENSLSVRRLSLIYI